jgi:FtsZ-interacting cell division protein YlmF
MTLSDVIPTIVDYFNKKEPQDSNEEPQDSNEEPQDSNEEPQDSNEEPQDSNEESMEKTFYTEFKQNVVDHASIYFRELNNDVNTPFWCIKDSNDFVEL